MTGVIVLRQGSPKSESTSIMKIAISTISVSPHILAVWQFVEKFLSDAIYYYHAAKHDSEREKFGWSNDAEVRVEMVTPENQCELENVSVLIETMRDFELISRRVRNGRFTVYFSERWFKPPWGILRLLHPRYFRMAYKFAKLFKSSYLYYLAGGVHAARDMARVIGIFNFDIRCLFRAPQFSAPRVPCARMKDFEKILLWGYFAESSGKKSVRNWHNPRKILWLGRMLHWKRTITIIEAVRRIEGFTLTIVGEGPEEEELKRATIGMSNVTFHKFVTANEAREMMRDHDIYILASDGSEGWGTTLNEALEEGMCVLGTYEAGASATILPDSCLFHAGDVNGLVQLLKSKMQFDSGIGDWQPNKAAEALINFIRRVYT